MTTTELVTGVVTLVAALSNTLSVVKAEGGVVMTFFPDTLEGGISARTEPTLGARAAAVSVRVGSLSVIVKGGVDTPEMNCDWAGIDVVISVCDLVKSVVVEVKTDTTVSVAVRVGITLVITTLLVLSSSVIHPTRASLSSCMEGPDVPLVMLA